jgi:4-amino-4-deoxy-L-arabinose transferase-like glycosyltransferase
MLTVQHSAARDGACYLYDCMQRALFAVAILALACLLLRSARVGLAGEYVDPIGKVTAQDEALYAHTAIQMAREGGWLTPTFMGRFALYKPPLLYWVAGLSARILGVSRLSLRLPVALIASLALGLVFLWVAELRSWQAGACAAILLASNHLWHVLAGMCMTDGILAALFIAAMYCLFSDPWLESKFALWGYAAAVAGAILTKSVAGLLPLGALGLYWLAAPPKERPAFRRVCLAAGLSLSLAAPWFIYQASVHGRWFWTEHVLVEILAFGAGAPPQTSRENQALFYLMRLPGIDPVLISLALVSLPGFWKELRKRSGPAILLACWMAVVVAAILAFQYRNLSYVLPIFPAFAILATAYGPYNSGRRVVWFLAFTAIAFAGKAAFPSAPWGLSFERGTIQPVAPLLSDYCEQARPHELILIGMDDDLYASALPLAKLRYSLIGGNANTGKYGMPFGYMGVILSPTPRRVGNPIRQAARYLDTRSFASRFGRDDSHPSQQRLPRPRKISRCHPRGARRARSN